MKKKRIIFIFIVIAIFVIFSLLALQQKHSADSAPTPTINITYQNIAQVLSGSGMVRAIPKNSELLLKFYSFNSGKRVWEKSYSLTSGIMRETVALNEQADIILSLDSRYLAGLTNKNFCSMIQQANKNGDLGFETEMSAVKLAWKFKSMYQYRGCFGF